MTNPQLINIFTAYTEEYPHEAQQLRPYREMLMASKAALADRSTLPVHITASALIINAARTQTLLVHHRLFQAWLQPGGHLEDQDSNPSQTAEREALEETGLTSLRRLLPGMGDMPFYLNYHEAPANPRRNELAHYHLDFRYAFEADDDAPLLPEVAAVHDVAWQPIDSVTDSSVRRSAAKLLSLLPS